MKLVGLTVVVAVETILSFGAARAQEPGNAAPAPIAAAPAAAPAAAAVDAENPPASAARAMTQPAAPPPDAPPRSQILFIPSLGIHSFQNDSAKDLDAGLRLQATVGGRVSDVVSVNVEVALDVMNPNNVPSGVDVSAMQYHGALSPLVHLGTGATEVVLGPKLGLFKMSVDASGGGQSVSSSAHGWLYGVNFGIFGRLNDKASLGGLLSFDFEKATEVCLSAPGAGEQCEGSNLGDSAKVLGVSLALML
jgi:hypothetical protein